MLNERALIARLESADTDELARMFLSTKVGEEKVLRTYLGDGLFRSMRNLALRRELRRGERGGDPGDDRNVVVIPGLLGSELTSKDGNGNPERIWLDPQRIATGELRRLRLNPNGLSEHDPEYRIKVTGVLKRYYGKLMLSLAENWNVHAFEYDWRKDLRLAAAQLQARINTWFPESAKVHIVAHCEGGLVARAFIAKYASRWEQGGRLIMLGTPNYGTFAAPQAITGHLETIQQIDLLDARHGRSESRTIINSFPSIYQLLPTPEATDPSGILYQANTYGAHLKLSQQHLESAKDFHDLLNGAEVDMNRMVYVCGHNQPTYVLKNIDQIAQYGPEHTSKHDQEYLNRVYALSRNGDGKVPHRLGVLREDHDIRRDDNCIPAFYLETSGSHLTTHPQVITAIEELLNTHQNLSIETGFHQRLARVSGLKPLLPEMLEDDIDTDEATPDRESETQTTSLRSSLDEDRKQIQSLVRRISVRGDQPDERGFVSVEERDIDQTLTRGFMTVAGARQAVSFVSELVPPKIRISIEFGDITDSVLRQKDSYVELDVDCLSFGHYSGNKPFGIMKTVDKKISLAMRGQPVDDDCDDESLIDEEIDETDMLLTQFTQRGTYRGELAESFLLPDPRDEKRLIVIAGMGEPGRFGVPELTLLTRELAWTLGRLRRKHLATALIGSGRGNIKVTDAIGGWIHGIKLAISGVANATDDDSKEGSSRQLEEVTFFFKNPSKLLKADEAILAEQAELRRRNRMEIEYVPLTEDEKKTFGEKALDYARAEMEKQLKSRHVKPVDPAPTRITVGVKGRTYHFGAITDEASVPQREIPLDPGLVTRANDELAAAATPDRQLELGQFMERLLIPEDLRSRLSTNAPLVMMLDSTTARIHWEMLAQSDLTAVKKTADEMGDGRGRRDQDDSRHRFLGTSRGFTRQLRTTLASSVPDPPPPVSRLLRVLIVADPAEDAHLPGAEEEGIEVGDLFERFNVLYGGSKNQIEVVRLYGPHEATRTAVMRHLMMRTYDVLHFAGHCMYDKENPSESGWIFSGGEKLSAHEINRVDRSPSLVFSNACESGITPARSDERSDNLAPSFAEAFFATGVTNFVCTAWPIDDRAARLFALTLYSKLLGLRVDEMHRPVSGTSDDLITMPLPMYQAMQAARLRIAERDNDIRTWGAYQHYGNPYFRLFDPSVFAKMSENRKEPEKPESHEQEWAAAGDESGPPKRHTK